MLLRADDVREVLEQVLPDDVITSLVRQVKFQERDRKLDALKLVRALVIAASTKHGGRQADAMRAYFEAGGSPVVRGAFYRWFCPELEQVMEAVAQRALAYVRDQKPDLPGWLGKHVRDWHIVDSTTIQVDDELKSLYPGTGNYAAIKVHKRYSVGVGTTVDYSISPARDHDSQHLKIDESWRSLGLLVDLGYASFQLLSDCELHGVMYVVRLKENWKPKVLEITRGTLRTTLMPGSDFDRVLADTVDLDGRVLDMDVELGKGSRAVRSRLVGVPAPDHGYRFYLTNLPPAVGPRQIADLYRVRWEIESDNKLNKSCLHIDEIGAKSKHSLHAMVHAAVISSMIACLIVHKHQIREAPARGDRTERTTPPLHPQLLARAMGSAASTIAEVMTLSGDQANKRWKEIAEHLHHLGKDPNWRRRPSILDQLRGWKISPARSKNAKLASQAA